MYTAVIGQRLSIRMQTIPLLNSIVQYVFPSPSPASASAMSGRPEVYSIWSVGRDGRPALRLLSVMPMRDLAVSCSMQKLEPPGLSTRALSQARY